MFWNRNHAEETKRRIKKAVDAERERCFKVFEEEKEALMSSFEDRIAYEIAERDAIADSLKREISRMNRQMLSNLKKAEKAHLWARTNARLTSELWVASKEFLELATGRYKYIGELKNEVETHLLSVDEDMKND